MSGLLPKERCVSCDAHRRTVGDYCSNCMGLIFVQPLLRDFGLKPFQAVNEQPGWGQLPLFLPGMRHSRS